MHPEIVAGPLITNVIVAVALTLTPVWARPGTYFGVRVSPEYRSTPEARQSRQNFRLKVWIATVFAVALSLAASAAGRPWVVVPGILIQLGTATVAFRTGWRTTRPHGLEPSSTRTAHLFAVAPRVPGGSILVAMPFLLLAWVSLYLKTKWSLIPARFPIHWDLQGHANGWRDRSFPGVFLPILIAFVIEVFALGAIVVQAHTARRAPAGSGLDRKNRAMLTVWVIVMWLIAVMFSLAALTPLILINGQFPIPLFVLMLIPLAGVAASIWLMARASSEPDDLPPDNTPNECWKWGQFYYNPDDSSLMIEKRFGIGYTLNFARWQSWLLLGVILALPIGIVLIARH